MTLPQAFPPCRSGELSLLLRPVYGDLQRRACNVAAATILLLLRFRDLIVPQKYFPLRPIYLSLCPFALLPLPLLGFHQHLLHRAVVARAYRHHAIPSQAKQPSYPPRRIPFL